LVLALAVVQVVVEPGHLASVVDLVVAAEAGAGAGVEVVVVVVVVVVDFEEQDSEEQDSAVQVAEANWAAD